MFDELRLPLRHLPRHGLLRLPRTRGRAVVCVDGCLWITVDDDPRDIVLGPGERHVFDGKAPALVTAFEPSALLLVDLGGEVVPPAPIAAPQPFAR